MTEVHVAYNNYNGHMTIICENFFPSSQNKLKQMLKIVDLADDPSQVDILEQFHTYLVNSIEEFQKNLGKIAEKYSISRTKYSEMLENVTNCKKSNGVPFTKDELKQAKEDLKEMKKEVNSLEYEFKSVQKKMQKTRVNAEIVEEWMEKWK